MSQLIEIGIKPNILVNVVLDMAVEIAIRAFLGAEGPMNVDAECGCDVHIYLFKTSIYKFLKSIGTMAYSVFFRLVHLAKG